PVFVARRIVLTVHSDLGAVGMMAAVATALAERGVPCNVFAGIYHDHLFVSPEDAPRAMSALEAIQARALDPGGHRATFQPQAPTRRRHTMSEWSDRWQAVLSDFERQRDELKVRMHLAKAEAREEMAKLESRMDALRLKAQSAGSEARDAMKDIGGAAEQLANEIRQGLDRVRKTL
ncbi:MAG TPA: ACT domain-containing protein, partial [Gemmatimonadales bacterium]|nr:ACT domain-containing protein [Gemmatimonadales bacterium]